jgi:uncharacterized protein YcfJ
MVITLKNTSGCVHSDYVVGFFVGTVVGFVVGTVVGFVVGFVFGTMVGFVVGCFIGFIAAAADLLVELLEKNLVNEG